MEPAAEASQEVARRKEPLGSLLRTRNSRIRVTVLVAKMAVLQRLNNLMCPVQEANLAKRSKAVQQEAREEAVPQERVAAAVAGARAEEAPRRTPSRRTSRRRPMLPTTRRSEKDHKTHNHLF